MCILKQYKQFSKQNATVDYLNYIIFQINTWTEYFSDVVIHHKLKMFSAVSLCKIRSLIALYQITVVYGGRHVCRWSVSPEMVVWLHLIDPVTVD